MSIWVPPAVLAEQEAERRLHERELLEQTVTEEVIERWDPELKRVSPHLHLVRASANAENPAFKPGFWHFLITPPGFPATVEPLQHPNGEFMEPGPQMFDLLDSMDLWDERVAQDRRALRERIDRAQRAAREAERAERAWEVDERWKAAKRASVSMNRSVPWTQNVSGRRAA